MISTDVLDTEDNSDDVLVDYDDTIMDEEDTGGLGEESTVTDVDEVEKRGVGGRGGASG